MYFYKSLKILKIQNTNSYDIIFNNKIHNKFNLNIKS